jgi:hypothetical protein
LADEYRVRPDVLSAALLDEVAERLRRLEELQAKPRGRIYPLKVEVAGTEEIPGTAVLDFVSSAPYTPLISLTIFNDGPDDVYPGVNERQTEARLVPRENLNVDYGAPRIERLILWVERGHRAVVRGFGVY